MSKVFRNDLTIKDIPNQIKLRDVFFSPNMKLLLVIVPVSLPPEPHSCDQHQQKSHSVFHQIHISGNKEYGCATLAKKT